MRRRLISLTLTAAVVAGAVAFVATRDGDDSASSASAGSSLATRTQDAGEVTVKATLRQLDGAGAVAHLVFDTHAVELDLDVAAGATLTVDGAAWPTSGGRATGPAATTGKGSCASRRRVRPRATPSCRSSGCPSPSRSDGPLRS
jgi:hypothetical protein